MALSYKITKQLVSVNGKKQQKFIARIASAPIVESDELSERVAKLSTFAKAETTAVLQLVGQTMKQLVTYGCSVRLEGIGIIRPTISAKAVDTLQECNAKTIKEVHLRLIPDKELLNELKNAPIRCFHKGTYETGDYFQNGCVRDATEDEKKQKKKISK